MSYRRGCRSSCTSRVELPTQSALLICGGILSAMAGGSAGRGYVWAMRRIARSRSFDFARVSEPATATATQEARALARPSHGMTPEKA